MIYVGFLCKVFRVEKVYNDTDRQRNELNAAISQLLLLWVLHVLHTIREENSEYFRIGNFWLIYHNICAFM